MNQPADAEVEIQREYYASTAANYDAMHVDVDERDEHYFALMFLLATLDYYQVRSILDIGSGTGRALTYIKAQRPDIRVVGIEPVAALREIGVRKGLGADELIDGDATQLAYADGEFDLVCEFGVLHHIKRHDLAVSEMLRVADKAILISDCNNFGSGSLAARSLKQLVNAVGLWKVADFIKTKGKGYTISAGDGLAYSYSVFNDYRRIQAQCSKIHLLNTNDGGVNPYRSASHVALLGVKKGA